MTTEHPDYSILAARIAVSNLHKMTKKSFSEVMTDCYTYVDAASGRASKMIADDVYEIIMKNKDALDSAIIYDRDYSYDYFGFKTLERSYLLKINGEIAERPQHMLMRVSVGIHKEDIERAIETYNLMSQKYFTHASPTLFNSGTPVPQMSSCFLVHMKDDSIEGIYDTLKTCAQISKCAGGIGLSVHNIRARNSYIRGTNGTSNGLTPMLRVFNSTARYVDQGGGKRPGAFAMYLEPWHPDIHDFLDLRKNTGSEENRCRDLFLALWVSDLFMKRVEENKDWSLFCPCECPGLSDCYGEEFEALYTKYEQQGKARKVLKAQELWFSIMEAQTETGTPYLLYKDACNSKSNQKNLGTIKCSNLCTEIVEYTAPDEVAVCNLASIGLPMFVQDGEFDHNMLMKVTKVITRNLNRVIDVNFYPVEEARRSNMRHRPIGLGIQGLADVFQKLKLPFDGEEARTLNREIMETIYFAAVTASTELAAEDGHYESYPGSPACQGHPAVRHVGGHPLAAVGLGVTQGGDCQARDAQLASCCADAHGLDVADPGQQRVLRAVHVQHLHPPCDVGRVCDREPTPAQGPDGPRAVGPVDEEPHPGAAGVGAGDRGDPGAPPGGVQDGVGAQDALHHRHGC